MLSSRPILCLVVDRKVSRLPLTVAIEAAVRAGVDWLQLRERELSDAALLEWCRMLVAAAQRGRAAGEPPVKVLVNRRVDIALVLAADGAHLGRDAMAVRDARRLLALGRLVGVSAHAPDEVAAAALAGASYAQLAPIFDPGSKPRERPALGLAALATAAAHGLPLLAQGGIDAARCREVIAAGAAGVAVTGDILMCHDPGAAAARLRAALDTQPGDAAPRERAATMRLRR